MKKYVLVLSIVIIALVFFIIHMSGTVHTEFVEEAAISMALSEDHQKNYMVIKNECIKKNDLYRVSVANFDDQITVIYEVKCYRRFNGDIAYYAYKVNVKKV